MIGMPIILHATWLTSGAPLSSGELFLWAENADVTLFDQRSSSVATGASRGRLSAAQSSAVNLKNPSTPASLGRTRSGSGKGGRQRTAAVPSHPAQIPLGQLRQLLRGPFAALPRKLRPTNVTVWLPSDGHAPLVRGGAQRGLFSPSNASISNTTQPGVDSTHSNGAALHTSAAPESASDARNMDAPHLAVWQVTGVTLPAIAALQLLSQLSDGATNALINEMQSADAGLSHRSRLGNDLLFWSRAAKYALEILAGQHYVPTLRPDETGRFVAVWQPSLLDETIRDRFDELAQNMPPVCRAYNLDAPTAAPSAIALLEHFSTVMVDSAVRAWSPAADALSPRKQTAAISADGEWSHENGAEHAQDVGEGAPALHWLTRLLSSERRLRLPPQPAHQLYRNWHTWVEQLFVAGDANFRICLKLEEPSVAGAAVLDADVPDETPITPNGEAPAPDSWRLHYYLQARDNPQLLISARRIWQTAGITLRCGERRIDQPQERLLAGLGAVSRLFAPIERSLRNPRPEGALLSTDEAYQFLREIGPLLEKSGCGVLLPEWWRERNHTRLGLRLQLFGAEMHEGRDDAGASPDSSGVVGAGARDGNSAPLGFNSLIRYSWKLTLGGRTVSPQEFARLTALRTPLVPIHGEWVELDPAQIDAAQRVLSLQNRSGSMSLLQALRISQGLLHDGAPAIASETLPLPALDELTSVPAGLVLEGVDAQGALLDVLERLHTQQPEQDVPEPAGFVGRLRPYQRRGVAWLAYLRKLGLGACLADDMGLGKTVQAIALHLHTRADRAARPNTEGASMDNGHATSTDIQNALRRPTLLICPTSVVANWRHEIERFAPGLRALVHHGNNRLDGAEFLAAATQHDFIITSYGTARRDVDLLTQRQWADVILDEAQNIKNPNAKQTQAVRRIPAHNRIALTGTPVENRLSELWSISEFLNPGYLGGFEQFRKQFVVPIERYNDSDRMARLRRLVQPFVLRRLKTDPTIISDLPEKNEMVVYCALTQEQRALYEQTVQRSLQTLRETSGMQRRGLVLGLLTKLKQIANHPAQFGKETITDADVSYQHRRSGKLTRLSEMLEEVLAADDRALIFTQFVEMGDLLQRYLTAAFGIEVLFLHGGTSATQRDRMVQLFQSTEGPPLFVLSLRAGGSGLNLTQANHVFHFDRWWNPAVENQATDRAFRIGQQRNVQVHKFVVAGTLEERIHELIESKQQLAENIIGSGEEWLTEMDTEELRDLLVLRDTVLDGEETD